jgi:hypothetical protein
MRHSLFAAALAVAFAVLTPAYAADPQTFKTEDSATAFCKTGNAAICASTLWPSVDTRA